MKKQPTVETRLASLEKRVASLEGRRSGRKPMPIVISEEGVCGIDPTLNSARCPYASLYRRQQGCLGVACIQKTAEYYREYRQQAKDAAVSE